MVRFEKDKLVIEIETAFPEEYVVELQRDLLCMSRSGCGRLPKPPDGGLRRFPRSASLAVSTTPPDWP